MLVTFLNNSNSSPVPFSPFLPYSSTFCFALKCAPSSTLPSPPSFAFLFFYPYAPNVRAILYRDMLSSSPSFAYCKSRFCKVFIPFSPSRYSLHLYFSDSAICCIRACQTACLQTYVLLYCIQYGWTALKPTKNTSLSQMP